jgi:hypothetical protein
MTPEQLEGLYGPIYPHSDHKRGEKIRFYDIVDKQEHEGSIVWIQRPGPNYQKGKDRPFCYILDIIDASNGFPYTVAPSDVIER